MDRTICDGRVSTRLEWIISRDYIIVGHEEVWTVRGGEMDHVFSSLASYSSTCQSFHLHGDMKD